MRWLELLVRCLARLVRCLARGNVPFARMNGAFVQMDGSGHTTDGLSTRKNGPFAQINAPFARMHGAFARGNVPFARGNEPNARGNGPVTPANPFFDSKNRLVCPQNGSRRRKAVPLESSNTSRSTIPQRIVRSQNRNRLIHYSPKLACLGLSIYSRCSRTTSVHASGNVTRIPSLVCSSLTDPSSQLVAVLTEWDRRTSTNSDAMGW